MIEREISQEEIRALTFGFNDWTKYRVLRYNDTRREGELVAEYDHLYNTYCANKPKTEVLGTALRCLPYEGLVEIGKIFEEGRKKYGLDNWKKGINDTAYQEERLEHALRHLMLWSNGDRAENHLAKVAWFCLTQLYFEARNNGSSS